MDKQRQKYISCDTCHGTGKKHLSLFGQCDTCGGTGKTINYPRILSLCHDVYLDDLVNLSHCLALIQEAEQLLPDPQEAQSNLYLFKKALAEVYYWKGCILMELQKNSEALSCLTTAEKCFDKSDSRYSYLKQSLTKLSNR